MIREICGEAGIHVTADKLTAVQYRNKQNEPIYVYGIVKIVVLCTAVDGTFVPNSETKLMLD